MNYNYSGYQLLDLTKLAYNWDDIPVNTPIPDDIFKILKNYIYVKSNKTLKVRVRNSNTGLYTIYSTSIALRDNNIYQARLFSTLNSDFGELSFSLEKKVFNPTNTSPASVETQSLDTEESKEVKS